MDAARSSLENLSRFIRNNPGAEGFLNRLGVQTRDASGNMRDMAAIFTGVGQKLSDMPYYRANQYAQMLGIDENTLLAMRRGVGGFSGQYSAMAKAIGFNADEAARSSNKFMTSCVSLARWQAWPVTKSALILRVGLRVRWTHCAAISGQLPAYRADPDESHKRHSGARGYYRAAVLQTD